mmetsp:Transcript_10530/g.21661  ORF Transcript_10530/g.21661 Transcript_10530/m.21661 type:complete len:501 (+) Transcript_10530:3146-4648(+)
MAHNTMRRQPESSSNKVRGVLKKAAAAVLLIVLVLLGFLQGHMLHPILSEVMTSEDKVYGSAVNNTPRTALVVRSMMPLHPKVLQRLEAIALTLALNETRYRNYEFVLLSDETSMNGTQEEVQRYFAKRYPFHPHQSFDNYHNTTFSIPSAAPWPGHNSDELLARRILARQPKIFVVTEQSIRQEYGAGLDLYVKGPMVNNATALCCGKPILWQLLVPTFVSFVKANPEYSYTWVFEDDLWALAAPLDLPAMMNHSTPPLAPAPIIEIMYQWDQLMLQKQHEEENVNQRHPSEFSLPSSFSVKPHTADLAALHTADNHCPFSLSIRGRHTWPFERLVQEMANTTDYRQAKRHHMAYFKLIENFRRPLGPPYADWTQHKYWNATARQYQTTPWTCISDSIYRHSRLFSLHLHEKISQGYYRFAEGFQHPFAWTGNFSIVDLEHLWNVSDTDAGPSGMERLTGIKVTDDEAQNRFSHYRTLRPYSYHLYHNEFAPQEGSKRI